jgi:DNA helicase TIP49 (TBP-interacting protein)
MEELIALEASFPEAEDRHVSTAIGTLAVVEGNPKLHGVVISGGRGTGKATLARASGREFGSRLLTVRLVRGERPKLARAGRLEDLPAHALRSACRAKVGARMKSWRCCGGGAATTHRKAPNAKRCCRQIA